MKFGKWKMETLPYKIILRIFSYVDIHDIIKLTLVNRKFNHIKRMRLFGKIE